MSLILYCQTIRSTVGRPTTRAWTGAALLLATGLFAGACNTSKATAPEPAAAPAPASQYRPTATVKDLMDAIVDPSADVVWNSIATVATLKGIEEHTPKTDEDWTEVRRGAIRIVEGANLLAMPGRLVARHGEKSDAPGVELEPEEIEANIKNDWPKWTARAMALHDAGIEALDAVEKRDVKVLFDVGEKIDHACEMCHATYWYPNQKLPPGYGETAPAAATQ